MTPMEASAPVDRGLVELTRPECMSLLAQQHFGRLGLSVDALPAVFPVHYAVVGDDVVFRTGSGTKLAAAAAGNVVCLEIDDHDPETHRGWSVMMTGRSRVVTDDAELVALRSLPLRPWVGDADSYVVIEHALVTGRRIASRHGH
jgi:nitroimidazol reductase NimA-like FMN-containing flavoprotein (pyridoxamine 5'-phosphate oxidase superfamily)